MSISRITIFCWFVDDGLGCSVLLFIFFQHCWLWKAQLKFLFRDSLVLVWKGRLQASACVAEESSKPTVREGLVVILCVFGCDWRHWALQASLLPTLPKLFLHFIDNSCVFISNGLPLSLKLCHIHHLKLFLTLTPLNHRIKIIRFEKFANNLTFLSIFINTASPVFSLSSLQNMLLFFTSTICQFYLKV